jgi:hypothetical protein
MGAFKFGAQAVMSVGQGKSFAEVIQSGDPAGLVLRTFLIEKGHSACGGLGDGGIVEQI